MTKTDGRYGYFYARDECPRCNVHLGIRRQLYVRFKRTELPILHKCGYHFYTVPIGWKAYCTAMLNGNLPLLQQY